MIDLFKDYIKNCQEVKLQKRKNFKRKTILNIKEENNSYFNENIISLYDIEKYNLRIRKRTRQNEINSICKKINEENKLLTFITTTLNPKMNLTETRLRREKTNFLIKDDNERITNILTRQYETFKKFNNKLVKHNYYVNNENKTLKTDFLRVLELTKKLNIHQHEIKLLNNINEVLELIKAVIYKRKNENIGRIEIRLDENLLNEILKKGIKLRINNKYINLTIKKTKFYKDKRTYFKLLETELEKGNFIYLKAIQDIENNNEHITKYLFKYLLKRSNEETFENKLFHNLDMRQKNYSQAFFTDKLTKQDLFNISSKLYRIITHNTHNNELLTNLKIDKKTTIYETRKFFNNEILEYDEKEKIIYINENGELKELFKIYKFIKDTKKGKWGELEVLEEKQQINKFFKIEDEYKLKKLTYKKKYEEYYFISKIILKKRELGISKKLETQYKTIKQKFKNTTFNDMNKIQKSFWKFEELNKYEIELKKDWELNFIFRIYFEYETEQEFIKYTDLRNFKRITLTEYRKEKEQILKDLIKQRDEKENYISNLIENKTYKIEQYEEF